MKIWENPGLESLCCPPAQILLLLVKSRPPQKKSQFNSVYLFTCETRVVFHDAARMALVSLIFSNRYVFEGTFFLSFFFWNGPNSSEAITTIISFSLFNSLHPSVLCVKASSMWWRVYGSPGPCLPACIAHFGVCVSFFHLLAWTLVALCLLLQFCSSETVKQSANNTAFLSSTGCSANCQPVWSSWQSPGL